MSSHEPASPDSPSITRPAIAPKLRTLTLAAALYFNPPTGPGPSAFSKPDTRRSGDEAASCALMTYDAVVARASRHAQSN